MGAAAGPAAAASSVVSLALTATGDVMKGSTTKAADDFQASRLQQAAAFGETQASLTDTTLRQNLNTTLGNIEAVRSAAGADPTSPTSIALMDQSTSRSDTQRMAAVGSIKAQNAEDLASADYLKRAGDFAVTQSYLSAATDIAGGASKAFTAKG